MCSVLIVLRTQLGWTVDASAMTLEQAIERVNKIDFSASSDAVFVGSILRPDGRMVALQDAYNLASNLIMYLIAGEYMDEDLLANLKKDWNTARGNYEDDESPLEGPPHASGVATHW